MDSILPRLAVTSIFALILTLSVTYVHAQAESDLTSSAGELKIEQLATLEYPWGMALLPDGRLLITEKPGRLRVWEQGELSAPIRGVPRVAYLNPGEQGGLLDVALDPDFENNNLVYLSFVETSKQQPSDIGETGDARFGGYLNMSDDVIRGGAVARGRLKGNKLQNVEVIWRQVPKTIGRGHFGHRLLFGPDDKLYITSGERMRFDPAQSLSMNLGKIVRINADGSTPKDNPFVEEKEAREDIWTYGHRNILSAAFDPTTGHLWAFEMGPLGGDELNLIKPGANYGWPTVSNGSDYNGQTITSHLATDEYEAPVRSWTPVISPSGALFYDGDLFKQWQGSALIGGLTSKGLVRLELDGERVLLEERIPLEKRIRDLIEMPDGSILLLVDDAKGELLRLTPAQETE